MVSILFYFLLGILTYSCIRPVLQEIIGLICQCLEYSKSKIILKQSKIQQQIDALDEHQDKSIANKLSQIGFMIDTDEEDEDFEEEEQENED